MRQDSHAGDKTHLSQPLLTTALLAVRRQLRWHLLAVLLLAGSAVFGGWLSLLSLAEKLVGMLEMTALALVALGMVLVAVFLWLLARWTLGKSRSLSQLSWQIEQAHPELQDAYACAVETENLDRPPREIELLQRERLLAKLEASPLDLKRVFASQLGWRRPVYCLLAALALLALGGSGRVSRKAYWGLRCLLDEHASGLVLEEMAAEYPTGSDVRISVKVRRWECEGILEWRDDDTGEIYSSAMTALPDRMLALTLFDVTSPLEFRVQTPSLRTQWHRLDVYEPPEARKVEIRTEPQGYTGRQPQVFDTWHDLSLVAGDKYSVRLSVKHGVTAKLLEDGREIAVAESTSEDELLLGETAVKSGRRQVVFGDEAGHRLAARPFRLEVLPDLPPVLEVKEPSAETKLHRGDDVRLKVFAGDDFGLRRVWLRYTISGGEPRELPLLTVSEDAQAVKEQEISQLWKLSELDLPDGEFVSAVVLAEDNREPTPQTTAGDLLFLTVLPREEEVQDEGNDGDSQQEEVKVDLGPLLAEAKRLLRLGWDNLALSRNLSARNQELERGQQEQERDLRKLATEVIRFGKDLQASSPGPLPPAVTSTLTQTSQLLEGAANLVSRWLLEEALRPQEQALALLVRLENELLKNAMRNMRGKSGGQQQSQGSGEGQQESGQQASQEQGQKQEDEAKLREELKQDLEQLRRLAQEQNKLNADVQSQQSLAQTLAERQERLRSETEQLAESLAQRRLTEAAAENLSQGGKEMERGTEALKQGQQDTASVHGQRALQQLQAAGRQLESALRQLRTARLRNLAGQAENLARRQEAEAEQTNEMSAKSTRAEVSEARQRQKELQKETEQLEQAMRREAESLAKDFPEASRELTAALERSRQRGLPNSQQKAGNALLYRRFEQAAKEQNKASNLLQALGQEVWEAMDKMPPVDSEELQRALEQLEKWRDELQQATRDRNAQRGQQRQRQVREQAAEQLGDLGRALQDQGLQEVSGRLAQAGKFDVTEGENALVTGELLRAAAIMLRRRLEAMAIEEKMRFSRETIRPPRQYRRQVEEYFRKLGGDK